MLNVRQSFLKASQDSAVRLVNLYITSNPPFAPETISTSNSTSSSPQGVSIEVQKIEYDEARYISFLEIYKADVWMYNVTLEGASEGSIEGVNVLGASSTTGRAYSEGVSALMHQIPSVTIMCNLHATSEHVSTELVNQSLFRGSFNDW